MALLVYFVLFLLLQGSAYSQLFSLDASTSSLGLQVDSTGSTYLAVRNYLYRLNAQLIQEERVDLGATVINRGLALSSTGMVVVCFEDLSCSVYNASNLSTGPIRSVSNACRSGLWSSYLRSRHFEFLHWCIDWCRTTNGPATIRRGVQ